MDLMNMKQRLFATTLACKYLQMMLSLRSFLRIICFGLKIFVDCFSRVSFFSASHSSSHSLILNLPNNLIFYQTILIPIFSNKTKNNIKLKLKRTKYQNTKMTYNVTKTFSEHGLLIDKYLGETTSNEDYTNDSFLKSHYIRIFCILFFLFLVYYCRDSLLRRFRERHKRSVLKYSV